MNQIYLTDTESTSRALFEGHISEHFLQELKDTKKILPQTFHGLDSPRTKWEGVPIRSTDYSTDSPTNASRGLFIMRVILSYNPI